MCWTICLDFFKPQEAYIVQLCPSVGVIAKSKVYPDSCFSYIENVYGNVVIKPEICECNFEQLSDELQSACT
jgi:hypothetical protein